MISKNHSFSVDVAVDLGGNLVAAVLFEHIAFWIEHNKANGKHLHKGRYWTFNSMRAFQDIYPYMTERKIRTAIDLLIDRGYLVKDNFNKHGFDRTQWYALGDKFIKKEDLILGEEMDESWFDDEKNIDLGQEMRAENDLQNVSLGQKVQKDVTSATDTGLEAKTEIVFKDGKFDFIRQKEESIRQKEESIRQNDGPIPVINSVINSVINLKEKNEKKKKCQMHFQIFWDRYPRKESRHRAYLIFERLFSSKDFDIDSCLKALENHIEIWIANKTEKQFIPMASTWLNQRRYLDEISTRDPARPAGISYKYDEKSVSGGFDDFFGGKK